MSAISIVGRALDRYEKVKESALKVRQAKERINQDRQLFDIKRQKAELELNEARISGRMTAMDEKIQKFFYDQMFKSQEAALTGMEAQNEMAEHNVAQESNALKEVITMALPAAKQEAEENAALTPDGYQSSLLNNPVKWGRGRGGHMMPKYDRPGQKAQKENANLGNVLADIEELNPQFSGDNKQAAERIALRKLGTTWKKDYPQVVEAIDKKFTDPSGYKVGDIKTFGVKGNWKYIGNNKWEKAK